MSPQQGNDSNRISGFPEEELEAWLMSDPDPEGATTLLPTDPEWQTWFANDPEFETAAEKARMEEMAAATKVDGANTTVQTLPANGGNMTEHIFPANGGNMTGHILGFNGNTTVQALPANINMEHIFPANGNTRGLLHYPTQPTTVSLSPWSYVAADHCAQQWQNLTATQRSPWTRFQNKAFEEAIATCPEGMENRWERVAALVPGGKTPARIKEHYDQQLRNISLIKCGRYSCLTEAMAAEMLAAEEMMAAAATKVGGGTTKHAPPANGHITERSPQVNGNGNRKKRQWTDKEHRLFLVGFKQLGKHWTNISRHFVLTRDPKQVASHAQKYFLHQSATEGKKRKRKSIHDITIEDIDTDPHLPPQL